MKKHLLFTLITFIFCFSNNHAESMPVGKGNNLPTHSVDLTNFLTVPWTDHAKSMGLTPEDIKKLEENQLLVIDSSYNQINQAYKDLPTPNFITSDCILNAYHLLYQESIFDLEHDMADTLEAILSGVSKNLSSSSYQLEGDPELISTAREIATIIAGVSQKILTPPKIPYRYDKNYRIELEYKMVVKAEGLHWPAWLGEKDPGEITIDYSRFKPRGFYTQTGRLSSYFRAVSWLQAMPLKAHRDEHLLAIYLLAESIQKTFDEAPTRKSLYNDYFYSYLNLLGGHDDWDIMTALKHLPTNTNNTDEILTQFRQALTKQLKDTPLVNDQFNLPPANPDIITYPNFRFISAHRIPSNILFTKTTDLRTFDRTFPKSVEIAALLGSSTAWDVIKTEENQELIDTIKSCEVYTVRNNQIFPTKNNSYLMYITALKYLLDEPDSRAPRFMFNDAWDRKSCNTVMASWTQQRYIWVLQVKETSMMGCNMPMAPPPPPPGFVEPDPEFFRQMAKLASQTKNVISQLNIPFRLSSNWDTMEENCKQLALIAEKQLENGDLDENESEYLDKIDKSLENILAFEQRSSATPEDSTPKIIDIYTNNNIGQYLHAAVGRSQRIYILYPWKEYTVLCSGAVIPYYELLSDQRLTDSDWRKKLDSPQSTPQQPDWIAPITSNR